MAALLLALLLTAGPEPIAFTPDAVVWRAAPGTLPAGAKVAVLEGDPTKPGLVTMRLSLPKGSRIPLHTHPTDERVTVLGGAMKVSSGSVVKTFPTGSFYVTPAGTPHEVAVAEDTVIQITVEGPWGLAPAPSAPAGAR